MSWRSSVDQKRQMMPRCWWSCCWCLRWMMEHRLMVADWVPCMMTVDGDRTHSVQGDSVRKRCLWLRWRLRPLSLREAQANAWVEWCPAKVIDWPGEVVVYCRRYSLVVVLLAIGTKRMRFHRHTERKELRNWMTRFFRQKRVYSVWMDCWNLN